MPDTMLDCGENPWRRLPDTSPFVLPEDAAAVHSFNAKVGQKSRSYLRIAEILPEPFNGARDARVVLLSSNPGFGPRSIHKQAQAFVERMRGNLRHEPSDYPFIYLDPKFNESSKWWEKKLKDLLARFDRQLLSQSVLNVPYFPYASERYAHKGLRLPSQDYGFCLVREAVKHGAVIVLMRKRPPWLTAVPELNK